MQRVLFLTYHGIGHFNPCFNLAAVLEKEGYTVGFAGVNFFHHYVSTQGFQYFGLQTIPFGSGFERWVNTVEKKKNLYLAELKDRYTDRLYKRREKELLAVLNTFKPHILLIDAFQATDFIVLYAWLKTNHVKTGIIHTMIPTDIVPHRPPLNSSVFPDDTKGIAKAVNAATRKKSIRLWKQKLKFFGMDDVYLIQRRLRKNKIPARYCSPRLTLVSFAVKQIAEFILAPYEFDFPGSKKEPQQHYIGFMNGHQRADPVDTEYAGMHNVICQQKRDKNMTLIYCAYGTTPIAQKEIVLAFLHKLINIMDSRDYILIISSRSLYDDIVKLQRSQKIYIFKSVPQVEVLGVADLFITHGGLNSIKESIDAEVPMLVYPVHPDYDAKGNAARVVYHNLGLRGDAETDSETDIKNKIEDLLGNAMYKKRLHTFKQKNARYQPEQFIALLKDLSPPC